MPYSLRFTLPEYPLLESTLCFDSPAYWKTGVVYNAIVGTGYVGKVSYTIKIKKNICGLAKSKYICGGNYRAMAVNQYDRSYDNMFILYNNEEGRYIIFS